MFSSRCRINPAWLLFAYQRRADTIGELAATTLNPCFGTREIWNHGTPYVYSINLKILDLMTRLLRDCITFAKNQDRRRLPITVDIAMTTSNLIDPTRTMF
jgi:hypothetical protein